MAPSFVAVAATRLGVALIYGIANVILPIRLLIWDLALTLYNSLTPLLPEDRVVPEGRPGENGLWPQYIPPKDTDSRSCCPMLNAMANHGILPRDGRNITFRDLNTKVRETYNFAPTFCFFVPHYAADMLGRNYWTDKFDLSDISAHNCIEHDGSLCRVDTFHNPDQSQPAPHLIKELLESASGPSGELTTSDLSRMLGKRRAQSRRTNGQYSQGLIHKLFGASNGSTLLTICGGRVKDLYPMLLEERIPDGWQPRIRHPGGLTMTTFQFTVAKVELGVKEEVEDTLRLLHMGGIGDDTKNQ
ncbi:chloroperoxidase-like protein [Daedalea quercina L-15889]|uniref:Chloroperoxidase-like protein n=1 Tax=Daedalea quercina L-15889 TaxID=1314783 RepID=A0A165KR55_9APHY|nr:chloroperoxidase-like protein [Daedalea quercina L-15889]